MSRLPRRRAVDGGVVSAGFMEQARRDVTRTLLGRPETRARQALGRQALGKARNAPLAKFARQRPRLATLILQAPEDAAAKLSLRRPALRALLDVCADDLVPVARDHLLGGALLLERREHGLFIR